jgi:hypothetical protein
MNAQGRLSETCIQPRPIKPHLHTSITSGLVLFLVFCNISATEFRRTNHQIIGLSGWVGFWIIQVVGSELRV